MIQQLPTPPAARKRGRPTIDPTGPGRREHVYLTPAEQAHARTLGGGSVPAGLRRLLRESMQGRLPVGE